jgi:hypothetical protein
MNADRPAEKLVCKVCGEDYVMTCPNCGVLLPTEFDEIFEVSGHERKEDRDNTIPGWRDEPG